MPKLPRLKGREMVAFLAKQGFFVARIRGSHYVMEKSHLRTVVPVHTGNMKIGTLRGILKDVQVSPAEFQRLWEES